MFTRNDKLTYHSLYNDLPTTINLRGVSTPSSQVAWVSGGNGILMYTLDHGVSWVSTKIPDTETLEFRDVKAFDANTVYVMSSGFGKDSRIYKTVNGGKSWQLQIQCNNSQEFFNCMAFWNRDHGMVLSDPVDGKFRLYVTKNGGENWSLTPESGMLEALKGEGAFAASGSCMTVQGQLDAWFGTGVNTARVFHTSDGGNSWQVINTPLIQDSKTSGIFSIAFYDLKNGAITGGDYSDPQKGGSNLAITNDGGLSWKLAEISPQYYWSAVSFTPDNESIMVVGTNQTGLTKSKSPQVWQKSCDVSLNAFSFWSKNKALAVGPKGAIVELEIPEDCNNYKNQD